MNLSVSNDKLNTTERQSLTKRQHQQITLQDDQSSQGDGVVLMPNSYRELIGKDTTENKLHDLKTETE